MKNKRFLKNLVMIIIILIMGGAIFFIGKYAKEHSESVSSNLMDNNMSTPPNMDNSSNENNMEKPSDNEENNMNEPPSNTEETNMEEPPEKPDEDTNQVDNSQSNNMVPDKPNSNEMSDTQNSSTNIDLIYCIIFMIEGLIISILIIYLIMSKFNKKTFKETFINKDKMIINILSIVILTTIITIISTKTTNEFVNNNTNNDIQNTNSQISYSSSKEITSDEVITDGEYSSTTEDENALLITGGDVDISNISVTKTGDSDGGDNTSFYGTNSAVLVKDGATVTLENITVETDATGANGIFSYGGSATTNNSSSDGTTITISNSTITTTKDNSGGIMTTGGGIMNANNLTITTSGTSSAAIRTDRGGGTVTVDGGTYTTNGQGSPTIYSTADITVSNATLIANASEGVVIEGNNSVVLDNVVLTDTNTKLNGKSTTYKNIFLYQSMSGDADTGTALFTAKNSTITTNNGDTLYITNTSATINLENNTIINNDTTGNFLRVQADSWGTSGSNGGDVILNMTNQKATGNIVIDSISTLNMAMKSNSYYEGTINSDNSASSITLTLDASSSIKLTGDSYVTSLENEDTTNSNIDFNGYTLYVNGVAIN